MSLVARAAGDPAALASDLRALVRGVDPDLPITRLATLSDLEAAVLVAPRFYALLIGSFGTLGLLLALVGVYGIAAHQTRGRAREIGVRLALGGESGRIVRQMVGGAVIASLAGVAAGILAGLGATRVLSTFLFDIEPTDPATFGVVAGLVALTTAAAAYLPARRATAIDPGTTLRSEG
jgi:putative ABC transport system permease protein